MPYPKSRSQNLDRSGEEVAGATLRPDELRLAWIDLELAPQTQNLDVHAAIEHFLVVHAAGGEQLLAAQYLLRRLEKGGQQVELAGRERGGLSSWRRQSARPHAELPPGKAVANALRILARSTLGGFGSAHDGAHPRQQLEHTERLGQVVVRAQFEADDPIRLLTAMTGHQNDRHVRSATEAAHEVEAVLVG